MKLLTSEKKLTPSWQLLRPSVYLLRKFFWPVVYLSFIPSLVVTVGLYILGDNPSKLPQGQVWVGSIVLGVGFLYAMVTNPGNIYMMTQAVKGKDPEPMESFRKGLPNLGALIGLNVLSIFLVGIGFLLLFFPGLIAMRTLLLAPYYLVDRELSPTEAIKMSYKETNPVSLYVWGVFGVVMFFVLLGLLFDRLPVVGPVVSLLITYPYVFALALRYGEVSKTGKPLAKLIPPKER